MSFLSVDPFSDERNEYLKSTLRQGSLQWSEQHSRFLDAWEREYSDQTIDRITTSLANAISDYGYSS